MKTTLIIPTWNAAIWLPAFIEALKALEPQPDRILFIDSSSTDNTREILEMANYNVHQIAQKDFGHGKTRNLGAQLCPEADILVYLTQDALPADTDLLTRIIRLFEQDPQAAMLFGRQLPHQDASVAARYARLCNYPSENRIITAADIPLRGIKAVFCSNSFAAYRAAALKAIGGFPEDLPLAEDMAAAGRFLEAGYHNHYLAEACVYHSHNYTPKQELMRYFDIGALLKVDPWFQKRNLKSGGEGLRFVMGEIQYTLKEGNFLDLLSIPPRTAAKLIGFKLGQHCKSLPLWILRRLSSYSHYWENTLKKNKDVAKPMDVGS